MTSAEVLTPWAVYIEANGVQTGLFRGLGSFLVWTPKTPKSGFSGLQRLCRALFGVSGVSGALQSLCRALQSLCRDFADMCRHVQTCARHLCRHVQTVCRHVDMLCNLCRDVANVVCMVAEVVRVCCDLFADIWHCCAMSKQSCVMLHKLFWSWILNKCCKKSAPVGFPVGWVRTPGFVAVWRQGMSLLLQLNYVNARTSARSDQSWDSGVPGIRGPETGSRGRARAVGVGARAVDGAWFPGFGIKWLTSLRSSLSCPAPEIVFISFFSRVLTLLRFSTADTRC